jgi:hypothetical protein
MGIRIEVFVNVHKSQNICFALHGKTETFAEIPFERSLVFVNVHGKLNSRLHVNNAS